MPKARWQCSCSRGRLHNHLHHQKEPDSDFHNATSPSMIHASSSCFRYSKPRSPSAVQLAFLAILFEFRASGLRNGVCWSDCQTKYSSDPQLLKASRHTHTHTSPPLVGGRVLCASGRHFDVLDTDHRTPKIFSTRITHTGHTSTSLCAPSALPSHLVKYTWPECNYASP
jgi:hypothetical protein